MRKKRWIVKERDQSKDLISHLMDSRGMSQVDRNIFFSPVMEDLLDPATMKGMNEAVDRIEKALKEDEKIWIYGDYDVDGISAVSILLLAFQKLGVSANYYIPERIEEGYGINEEALSFIRKNNADLIISVDCGITAVDEVEFAKKIGLDLIITDHHQCKEELPTAVSVINPKQPGCHYQNSNLCGAGIALKLAQAILLRQKVQADLDEFLEIAAVATIADIVELSEENRTIVKLGLESLKAPLNYGLEALIVSSGLKAKHINSSHIAFGIAPRINSSGRMGKANLGVELLISSTKKEAESIADMLEVLNKQRQAIEAIIYEQALAICETKKDNPILIASSTNWHSGVIGIVASKITEKFHKPSIILSIEEGNIGKGSGRSIEGFNLFEALKSTGSILKKFGGHEQAAGMTIETAYIDEFDRKINEVASAFFQKNVLVPTISVDASISEAEINLPLYERLECLEPFGLGNLRPVFLLQNVSVKNLKKIGKNESHVKAQLNREVDIIAFNRADELMSLDFSQKMDLVFELNKNEYMGKQKLQLLLHDIRYSYPMKQYIDVFSESVKHFKLHQSKKNKKNTHSYEKVSRMKAMEVWKLCEICPCLFLCYSPQSFQYVIKNLYYRNIVFSIKIDGNIKISHVLLMPIIDKLDVSIYNNIILCDEAHLEALFEAFSDPVFHLLESEYRRNEVIPSRSSVVKIYSLISQKSESVFNIDELCDFFGMDIFELILCLEILEDMSYVRYCFDSMKKNIKINYTSNNNHQKYDLADTKTVATFHVLR